MINNRENMDRNNKYINRSFHKLNETANFGLGDENNKKNISQQIVTFSED